MKRYLLATVAACLLSAMLHAQAPQCSGSPVTCNSNSQIANTHQVMPAAVPTSPAIIAGADAYLQEVHVANPTGSAITFTLSDRQGSPIAAIPAVSVAANSVAIFVWPVPYYWCPSGFTITASAPGLTWWGAFKL